MASLLTLEGVRAAGLADGRARRPRAPMLQHVRWVWMNHARPSASAIEVVDALEVYERAWATGYKAGR